LERFLNVFQNGVDTAHAKAWDLLKLKNVEDIPDKFLQFVAEQVGHEWDSSKTMVWNRSRIRDCINRHSYKGTVTRLTDDMVELGAESVSVQDNASKLLILSKQGRLSEPDSYMVTANFWHDGAYVLRVVDNVVPSLLRSEVEPVMRKTVPAGTIWYLQYGRQLFSIWEMDVSLLHGQALRTGNQRIGTLGFGQLIVDYFDDDNEILSWLPNRQVQKSYYPIVWHYKGNTLEQTLGNGLLGEDVFLSFCPTISLVKYHYDAVYHEGGVFVGDGLLGDNILGYDLSLSYPLETPSVHVQYIQKLVLFDCGPTDAIEGSFDQLAVVFDLDILKSRTGYIQQIETGDSEDSRPQITGYVEQFSIFQSYLTGDSNLPGNIDSIDGNQGTPDIPLTEYQASLQAASTKASEEYDWLITDLIDAGDTDPAYTLVIFGGHTSYEHELEYDGGFLTS
jgi:hypothetical protein